MRFTETHIVGVMGITVEPYVDERGFFARTWCRQDFAGRGLPDPMVQASMSHNTRRGTVRGMHFQWPPSREAKLVRCESGSIYDVVIDLRPDSTTFLSHFGTVLDAATGRGLYIPPGCAHGFQTLEDDVRVGYLMTDVYDPALATGVSWCDPAFGISWPLPVTVISPRDSSLPVFDRQRHEDAYRRGLEASRE